MAKTTDDYVPGPAGRERWGYLVLGAVLAKCAEDGVPGPDARTRREIVGLTWDEAQALGAIRRVVETVKFDRSTAALRWLRETNKLAGRGGA